MISAEELLFAAPATASSSGSHLTQMNATTWKIETASNVFKCTFHSAIVAQLWSTSGQSGQPAPFSPHGSFHQTVCVELIGPTTIFPLCAPCISLQHFCLHAMTQCGAKFAQAHRPYDTGTKERTATAVPPIQQAFAHACQMFQDHFVIRAANRPPQDPLQIVIWNLKPSTSGTETIAVPCQVIPIWQ